MMHAGSSPLLDGVGLGWPAGGIAFIVLLLLLGGILVVLHDRQARRSLGRRQDG